MIERDRGRERLDELLVARGFVPTRTQARALVLAGRVACAGQRLDKPGLRLAHDSPLEIRAGARYVGRGALKLQPALERFAIDPAGCDALDVGASTGGFTQVLLERGARRVLALDVGRGQLDWSLRNDPRVVVMEGLNARHLAPGDLPCLPQLAVIDVSFISLRLVLVPVASCLARPATLLALVKPQFEVGRGQVGRGGLVKDVRLHRSVLTALVAFAGQQGLVPRDVARAAVCGRDGNQEFFLHLGPGSAAVEANALDRAVDQALDPPHEEPP